MSTFIKPAAFAMIMALAACSGDDEDTGDTGAADEAADSAQEGSDD